MWVIIILRPHAVNVGYLEMHFMMEFESLTNKSISLSIAIRIPIMFSKTIPPLQGNGFRFRKS